MAIFSKSTGFQAVSAQQDLIELTAGANSSLIVHEVRISQTSDYGDAEAEGLQVRLLRYSGTFTAGSGGTADIGEVKYGVDNQKNSDVVVDRNHTTIAAVGTGQEDLLIEDGFNAQVGFHWLPTPELRPVVRATDAFVVRLQAAPADALTLNATIVWEEV